jgi:hypothetical protein
VSVSTTQHGLVGRQPVVELLTSSVTAVVSGFAGSGKTALLDEAGAALLAAGECIVLASAGRAERPLPLSYLGYLTVLLPDRPDEPVHITLPAPGDEDLIMSAVSWRDAPWLVERVVSRLMPWLAGHRVTLLADDLDAADALSLSLLPFVQRRLQSRLMVAARAPAAGAFVRPVVAAAVTRLSRPDRVHLLGLDDEEAWTMLRRRFPGSTPGLLRAARPALGQWVGMPGLLIGVAQELLRTEGASAGEARLPADHPLVVQWRHHHPAAALLATAPAAGGLKLRDVDALAGVLGVDPAMIVATLDTLVAEALLVGPPDRWRTSLPALAHTLAGERLSAAATLALVATGWDGEDLAVRVAAMASSASPRSRAHPQVLGMLVSALARHGPPAGLLMPADLRARLLSALVDELQAWLVHRPGKESEVRSLARHDVETLVDLCQAASLAGHDPVAHQLRAATTRILRRLAREASPPERWIRAALARHLGRTTAGAGPASLLLRSAITAATDGTSQSWSAAWTRFEGARPAPEPVAPTPPQPDSTFENGASAGRQLRALAGWASRSELVAALYGHHGGPAMDFLTGAWNAVLESTDDDDTVRALALIVSVHRREAALIRSLSRHLREQRRGHRHPLIGFALSELALEQDSHLGTVLEDLGADLRYVRQHGPLVGHDLLLFQAGSVSLKIGLKDAHRNFSRELDVVAADVQTPRAQALALQLQLRAAACAVQPASVGDVAVAGLQALLRSPTSRPELGALHDAQMMLAVAEWLASGDPLRADYGVRAGQTLRILGAPVLLARARGLSRQDGVTAGTRSQATTEQIRRLVGQGLSNRQISAQLCLSEKSVESYITRLLRTYGCANRFELAAARL